MNNELTTRNEKEFTMNAIDLATRLKAKCKSMGREWFDVCMPEAMYHEKLWKYARELLETRYEQIPSGLPLKIANDPKYNTDHKFMWHEESYEDFVHKYDKEIARWLKRK